MPDALGSGRFDIVKRISKADVARQEERPHRVLVVHTMYRERGGEDMVFKAETGLLRSNGVDVEELLFDNRRLNSKSILDSAKLASSTLWSSEGAERLKRAVRKSKPDLVHFHNTFPQVSPSAYAVCRRARLPIVQTLHNYRLICANGLFFRDGRPCEDCLGPLLAWPAVGHGCYRHSRPQSAVVATLIAIQRFRRRWLREVDMFIALSEFARRKFIQAGLEPSRVVHKGNFVDPDPGEGKVPRNGFLFTGRLVDYKGIETLVTAWMRSRLQDSLRIIGDGPLGETVRHSVRQSGNVDMTGQVSRDVVIKEMQRASALVFPSECYENFPVTIAEAFACGLPVIAARVGVMAELIDDGATGLLFTAGDADDLVQKLTWARSHSAEMRRMGRSARRTYEAKYTAETNYAQLMAVYTRALMVKRALDVGSEH